MVSYQTSPKEQNSELLKYNLLEMKEEKLPLPGKILDTAISNDGQYLYAINYSKETNNKFTILNRISVSPLKLESTLDVGQNAYEIHLLSRERMAIIGINHNKTVFNPVGSVKLIDTSKNKIVAQQELNLDYATVEKDPKNNVIYIVNYKFSTWDVFGAKSVKGKYSLLRIDPNGIQVKDSAQAFIGLKYIDSLDSLFVLNGSSLRIINYREARDNEYETGKNYEFTKNDEYRGYEMHLMPNSNLLAIIDPVFYQVKFFDLNQNKVLSEVKSGHGGKKFLNRATDIGKLKSLVDLVELISVINHPFFNDTLKTIVAYHPVSQKSYIFNEMTSDITIYDQSFKKKGRITPEEEMVSMFQSSDEKGDIFVSTRERLYRLNCDTDTLMPILTFGNEIKKDSLLIRDNYLFYLSDQELAVIDVNNYQVKSVLGLRDKKGNAKLLLL